MDKKVFFVINTLQGGGAERVVSTLANRFHELNYKVSIVCLNQAESVYQLPSDLKVIHLVSRKSDSYFLRAYYAASLFVKLCHLLLTKRPNCIISFMTVANIWTGISSLCTRTTYVVSERTTPDHTINQYNGVFQWLSSFIYKNAKAIVIPSKGIEVCLKKNSHFTKLTNYKVIQNPINKVVSPQIQNKVNPYKYILGVGRLSYEKGFDQLITAYHKAQLPKDIYLLIIGEGPEEGSLKNQIDVLGLQKRVKLLGFKKDVYNYYQGAELFVLPSRNEGYPNALIEAMSMGCACISMDCEFGPSEIIQHNHNGLLVADKDVTGLSYAITLLIHDSSLKAKLAENAKKINITNDLDSITSQWEAII